MSIDRPSIAIVVREILLDLTCAARCDSRVLITGEIGAGKRELAEMIHRGSRRAGGRFVTVDCAATADAPLEAKLFGRARTSVTGPDRDTRGLLEQTHGGTILLENVGGLGAPLQARLLRFLEDGRIRRVGADRAHMVVDVRVISSADRDLFARTEANLFNRDLYYRLNVVHLMMPAARRRDDSSGAECA